MENLYSEFGDPRYMASPVIKKLVRAKRYGVQTCCGFYTYDQYGKIISPGPISTGKV